VVKVHRLREVTCLYGFTRLEPPPTMAESELDEIQLAIGGADLARTVEWLPAIERFGEGIFLHVAPEFVKTWLDSPEIIEKAASFRDRERRDAERFNRPPVHFGAAYWALHSLSHAFMAELALECGYPLSSLKERIYSSGPAQPDRFGILIYTSTAGGQGTLGGLSSMAEQAGELLARATKAARPLLERPHLRRACRRNRRLPLTRLGMPRVPFGTRDVLRVAKYAIGSRAADSDRSRRWISPVLLVELHDEALAILVRPDCADRGPVALIGFLGLGDRIDAVRRALENRGIAAQGLAARCMRETFM
jgi:hypothetical protein